MRDRLKLRKMKRVELVHTSMLRERTKRGRREERRKKTGLINEIRARQSFHVGAGKGKESE